jgi:hypothetical protein
MPSFTHAQHVGLTARFVSLQDPDGIQIELWLTVVSHQVAGEPT